MPPVKEATLRDRFRAVLEKAGYTLLPSGRDRSQYVRETKNCQEVVTLAQVIRPCGNGSPFHNVGIYTLVRNGRQVQVDTLDYSFSDGCWRRTPPSAALLRMLESASQCPRIEYTL